MEQKKTFFQQWGGVLIFAVVATCGLLGFRLWTDFQSNEPVFAGYQAYLDELASRSTSAKKYREDYHALFERKTIASKHYEQVCAVMTRLAKAQGGEPEKISQKMADGCIQFGSYYITDDLPSPESESRSS
jgi:predicted negative regulator of RcsB-dependent stress response